MSAATAEQTRDFSRSALRWLLGRALFWAGVLLTILFLTFFGLQMARGAAASEALAQAASSTLEYLGRLLRADLGTAYAAQLGQRRVEIAQVLRETVPRSLGLLAVSLGLSAFLGVLLGFWSARRKRAPVLLLSILGISLPSFLLALTLQTLLVQWTKRFGTALLPVGGFGWDAHLLLPALVLAARPVAQITRVTYVSLLETLEEDYVRTARGKGLPSRLVWWRHVLRSAAPPILTTVSNSLRFSLSTLPVVEIYFGWPGIGLALLRAIGRGDDLLSAALALWLGVVFLLLTTLTELATRRMDPRQNGASNAQLESPASWREKLENLRLAMLDLLPGRRRERMPALVMAPEAELASRGQEPNSLQRRKAVLGIALRNGIFLLGLLMVVLLALLYFAGPSLATHNPFATQGLSYEGGEFASPPFPPGEQYRLGTDVLGRDLFTLLVVGARQTLTLVLFAAGARLLIGTLLGLLAGMGIGRLLDRVASAVSQVISALPALIVAMILILGLGVRKGLSVFTIGLAAVGWGEIYTFVRAETQRLLGRPFVESAISSGNSSAGVALRHVFPNLVPSLISLAALEMASVMMIVGELGFLGIFIGGGLFVELFIGLPPYHYSDVPEWASLLSNVRLYARSYPLTAFYPSLAFFFGVAAFNLFGEGLRRLLPQIGFGITRLFNRYTLTAALALVGLGIWVDRSAGSMAVYRQLSSSFQSERASATTDLLAGELAASRGIGTEGQWQTAEHLAERLEALGLQPAGAAGSYLHVVKRDYFELTAVPLLEISGREGDLVYHRDYVESPSVLMSAGEAQGELVVVGLSELTSSSVHYGRLPISPALAELKLADKVVMLLHPMPLYLWGDYPRQGSLMVSDDPSLVERRQTLSAYSYFGAPENPRALPPSMTISRQLAQDLLAQAGLSLAQLEKEAALLPPDAVLRWETGIDVRMKIAGERHVKVQVPHVLAYWPGVDDQLDQELIVLMAPYDGLRPDIEGLQVAGAVNDASSVSIVLEALRALAEGGQPPRRTIYVAFYASQGHDFGKLPAAVPRVQDLLSVKAGFGLLTPEAVIWVLGAGGGQGDQIVVGGGGHMRLTELAEKAARLSGARSLRQLTPLDISVIVSDEPGMVQPGFPTISLGWQGGRELWGLPQDDPSALRPEAVEKVGQTLTLLLAILGREPVY